jgi:hypothetical protein
MKPTTLQRGVLAALLWLLALGLVPSLYAEPEPILAPFGLSWGLAPDDLVEIFHRSKIPIAAKVQEGDSLRIEVTGLPQKNLLRAIFHFRAGILCEVELRLGQPAWAASDYYRFFLESKKVLDSRYGRGVPLVLEKRNEGDVETYLGGCYWSQFGGNLRLILFDARNTSEETQVLSQHYRAY